MTALLIEFNWVVDVMKYIDLYANICHNDVKATDLLRGDFDLKWF